VNQILREIYQGVKHQLSEVASGRSKFFFWNLGCLDIELEKRLHLAKTVLRDLEIRSSLSIDCCLSEEEIELFVSNFVSLREEVKAAKADRSKYNEWVAFNPRCVSFETWERLNYIIFDRLDLHLDVEEDIKCKLALDLALENITAGTAGAICNLDFSVDVTEHTCKQALSILLEEYPDCNLDFKTVAKALECGLSIEGMKSILHDGCQIKLNTDTDLLEVITLDNVYKINASPND